MQDEVCTSRTHQILFGGVHLLSMTCTAPTQLSEATAFQKGVWRRPPANSRKSCWFCTHKCQLNQARAQQAATHICQSAIPICVVLLELVVYLTVPAEHLHCLTEGCSPPVTYEPGWALGSSCNKFYPRAPISSSEWFHKVITEMIPVTQQTQHNTARGAVVITC